MMLSILSATSFKPPVSIYLCTIVDLCAMGDLCAIVVHNGWDKSMPWEVFLLSKVYEYRDIVCIVINLKVLEPTRVQLQEVK